tara:strand:- start:147 stop:788 length:642 start_codon:yes stop_codon:yes gene_type:complete
MNNTESLPMLTEDRNILIFWEEAKPNGLNVGQFNSVLMVRIEVPGDNKSKPEYMVQETYPEAFPHAIYGKLRKNDIIWARYGKYIEKYLSSNEGTVVAGTPIEAWPMVGRAQIAMLRHNCVYSVEALAGLTDQQIAAVGIEGRKLVQQAKDYLSASVNSQAAAEAQDRERKMETRFAALEENYSILAEALEALPPEGKEQVKAHISKRGRKAA